MNKNFLKLFAMCLMTMLFAMPSTMNAKKKLHTIGDSTMANYAEDNAQNQRGWCQVLQQFFNSDNLTVNNRGKSGASSKSFYKEAAYWPTLIKGGSDQMQEGDILLIQFAHNDEKNGGADGDDVRAYETKVNGSTSADYRGTTASGTYKEYIRKYITEAKAMGVKPIVVGGICRKYFQNGEIRRNGRHDLGDSFTICDGNTYSTGNKVAATDHTYDYPYQSSLVAAEFDDVPYIDLTSLTAKLYTDYGETYCTENMFISSDSTHPCLLGATLIARTFAQAVKAAYEAETSAAKKAVLKELYDELVLSSDVSFNPVSGDLGEAYAGKYAKKQYSISAFGLTNAKGEVTIAASEGFEVSADGQTWSTSIKASYDNSTLITSVYVRTKIAAVGTTTGTLTVSDGTISRTLDLSATGKSLIQGTETTCVWPMNTKSVDPTSELLTAKAGVSVGMTEVKGTVTPTTPEGHAAMAYFDIEGSNWPANEIDEVSTRYIQFQATVPSSKDFYLDNISYDVMGWGGNSVCYRAYYATKADFSDQQEIATLKPMTAKTAYSVDKEVNLKVSEGESIYIRFYPWLNNQSLASGKYLAIGGLTLHGTLADAGGDIITIDDAAVNNPFLNGKLDVFTFSSEQVEACMATPTLTLGKNLAYSQTRTMGGYVANNIKNVSGASLPSSAGDDNAILMTVRPADGFTFIPEQVTFSASRVGTGGGYLAVDVIAGEKSVNLASQWAPGSYSTAPYYIDFSQDVDGVEGTTEAPVVLRISLTGLGANKEINFHDIKVSGKLFGSQSTATRYPLTLAASPVEGGTVSAEQAMDDYKEGSTVTVKAAKNFGYKFKEWQNEEGVSVATTEEATVTMDAAKTMTAVFETVPVYTVDAIVKNDLDLALGSVTLTPNDHNGKYEEGTEVTVKAETSKILKFMNWEDNSTANPRSITVDKDITVTANYEVQDFIAVFDASKAPAYDYTGAGFNADLTWDANRNATCKIVKVSDGSGIYTNDGKTVGNSGTPVVRNREGVVLAGINGLYQNGYNTADIAWQYQFSTKDFTSAKFVADMAAKNMADKTYKAQYSLDGTSFTDIADATWDVTANLVCPVEFDLPAEAVGQEMVYIRVTGTGAAQLSSAYSYEKDPFLGLNYYSHSESGIGNLYILGEAVTATDEVAPQMVSTIPVANATGIPASGNIVISFDEKIQLSNKVNGFATLNGEKLEPVASSKSVSFQYVNLEYGKTYTFAMPAGFVEDKSGNAADAVELTFTVMERVKPTARIFDAVVDKTLDLKYGESIAATETMPKQYRYIQDAINDAPAASTKPYLIYIKEGYYDDGNPYFNDSYGQRYDLTKPSGNAYEVINNSVNGNGTDKNDPSKKYDECKLIYINKPNIHLIGQATDKVTIATDRMDGGDASRPEKVWYHVNAGAAVEIQKGADDALLSTLTIDNENWTKEKKEGPQALCLNTEADRLVFNELNVQSYQDDYKCSGTYNRAFWFKSRFEGSVDYIYGDCDVWFEECIQDINRKAGGYIVAPSHPKDTRWGYVFNNNTIKSSMFGADCQVWLGRPWHNYPKTVFMNTKVETKTYDGYWAETMGGLPALWAVKNLTDKNGIALSEQSRSSYYAIQPEGYFADGTYTSKVDNGDGRFKFTNDNTKNSLTNEEFAEYTVQNVLAGDKSTDPTGYWNPLLQVEKTATPAVTVNGNIAKWTADEYAICYVVTVNGKPSAFVTDAQYVGNEGDVVTVQSVNENGILSAMSSEVTLYAATAVVSVMGNANGNAQNAAIYTIDGKKVNAKSQRGIYIQNGVKTTK